MLELCLPVVLSQSCRSGPISSRWPLRFRISKECTSQREMKMMSALRRAEKHHEYEKLPGALTVAFVAALKESVRI